MLKLTCDAEHKASNNLARQAHTTRFREMAKRRNEQGRRHSDDMGCSNLQDVWALHSGFNHMITLEENRRSSFWNCLDAHRLMDGVLSIYCKAKSAVATVPSFSTKQESV